MKNLSKTRARRICKCRCHKDTDGNWSYCMTCLKEECAVYRFLQTYHKGKKIVTEEHCYSCGVKHEKSLVASVCKKCLGKINVDSKQEEIIDEDKKIFKLGKYIFSFSKLKTK